jgi:hypothetical protein
VKGIVTCDEDLDDLVSQYSIKNLHTHDQRMQLAERVLSKHGVDASLFSEASTIVQTDSDRTNLDVDALFHILYGGKGSIELENIDFPTVDPAHLNAEEARLSTICSTLPLRACM